MNFVSDKTRKYFNAGEMFCRMVNAGSRFDDCIKAMKDSNISMPMEKLARFYVERSPRRNAADEVKQHMESIKVSQ